MNNEGDTEAESEVGTEPESEIERPNSEDNEGSEDDGHSLHTEDPFELLEESPPTTELDDVFVEMDVEEIDEDALWEDLFDEESAAADDNASSPSDRTTPGGTLGSTSPDGIGIGENQPIGEAIVPKDQYCERCEWFSPPPSVSCTHSGSEIREFVDTDKFVVVDCPVVTERRSSNDEVLSQ